ncbi:hypothetical protein [Bradyrhizobium ottawaense]|uniref:hypothetical protein n=1 Tax=Bradyrhizobium ottawaense TaxID=931866 RepID=UPI003F9F2266
MSSLIPTPTPALSFHPKVGQIIALAAFGEQFRGFLHVMIAREEMRCISYQGRKYVVLDEIEPYSPGGVDLYETFAGVMLPANEPSIGAASALADSSKRDAVQASRRYLIKLNDVFPSAEASFAPSNPFMISSKRDLPGHFWRDVAFVGANLAGAEEAKRMNEAFAVLATSFASGLAYQGLAHFHKALLSTAAPELVPKFEWIWSSGGTRFISPDRLTVALEKFSRLTLTFSGYRGDPEGSETPGYIMDLYRAY